MTRTMSAYASLIATVNGTVFCVLFLQFDMIILLHLNNGAGTLDARTARMALAAATTYVYLLFVINITSRVLINMVYMHKHYYNHYYVRTRAHTLVDGQVQARAYTHMAGPSDGRDARDKN